MRRRLAAAASWLSIVLCLAPLEVVAQTQIGATELAHAKTALELSRAQLTAEQYALLSRKLAAAESAYMELTTAARASQAAAVAAKGGATATGARALLSGAVEVLPFILLVWPATAHAPGVKEETPEVQVATTKAEKALEELAQAARQVESDREALEAARKKPKPAPAPAAEPAKEAAKKGDRDKCGTCGCFYRGFGPEFPGQKATRKDCKDYCQSDEDGHRPANGMKCTGDKAVEWWN